MIVILLIALIFYYCFMIVDFALDRFDNKFECILSFLIPFYQWIVYIIKYFK